MKGISGSRVWNVARGDEGEGYPCMLSN